MAGNGNNLRRKLAMAMAMDQFHDRDAVIEKIVDKDGKELVTALERQEKALEDWQEARTGAMEPEASKAAREEFEKNHSFKVGDRVIISEDPKIMEELKTIDVHKDPLEAHSKLLRAFQVPYYGKVGTVVRIATNPKSGASISVDFEGMVLRFHNPNRDLILATEIGLLLYDR